MAQPATACLTEDDLLALGRGTSLADSPAIEAHLASCATCAALLASVVDDRSAWNARAGTQLGPYKLESQIGAGGMGAVYRATDTRLGRAIAVKILQGDAIEARAAAAIDHPAIVAVHDVGTVDGITYVAMELVDGESLRSVIERGADPARAREVAIELADALAAAHARGVIHRDLKPENLIVAKGGRLRVLDFGLAKIVDADPLDATVPGTVQGTAGYMAPEQARGEIVDARADIFALGAIVFEVATGTRAFPGATHADRLSAVLRDTPATDSLGALGPIVARCLAKEPAARFQSAADLAWTLRREAPPIAKPSRRGLIVGVGAAALAGAAAFVLGRRRDAAAPHQVEYRQLTFKTGRVYTARFTPDGNRLVFGAAWDADPVRGYVADLATGSTSALDFDGDILAVSPRGELAICQQRRFTEHQSSTGTLVVRPLGGGAPRVLAEQVQDADYHGDALAIIRRTANGFAIELPIGTPIVESPRWLTHARISPDGTRIAYLEHPHTNDDAGDLVVVDVATKRRTVVAAGWDSIAGLAWDPSGELWFTAARGHGLNLVYAVMPGGTPRTITQTTGRMRLHDLMGARRDRRVAMTVDAWRLRTVTNEGDRSLSEISFVSDISADARTLAVGEQGSAETANGAYLVPVAGGNPLRLGPGFPLAISPSGQRVAANVDGKLVVYAIASAERVVIATPGHVGNARWIDETSLVAASGGALWRLAIGAQPQQLGDAAGKLAIDPARTRCAFIDRGGKMQLRGLGSSGLLAGTFGASFAGKFVCGWLAAPDAIVTCTMTTPLVLERVDPKTGAVTPHLELAPPPLGLKAVDTVVLHADGTRYAYSYGQELSQLFVMS